MPPPSPGCRLPDDVVRAFSEQDPIGAEGQSAVAAGTGTPNTPCRALRQLRDLSCAILRAIDS